MTRSHFTAALFFSANAHAAACALSTARTRSHRARGYAPRSASVFDAWYFAACDAARPSSATSLGASVFQFSSFKMPSSEALNTEAQEERTTMRLTPGLVYAGGTGGARAD